MVGWPRCCLFMKHYYKNEALFSETKIVTSVYSQSFEGSLDVEMINKIIWTESSEAISDLKTPDYESIIKLQFSIQIQLLSRQTACLQV
jgi:hypothetical protein